MRKNSLPESAFFNSRCLLAVLLCLSGTFLAALSFARMPNEVGESSRKHPLDISKHVQRVPRIKPGQSTTTSAPSGPGWSIVTSPNNGTDKWNFLSDVTCLSVIDCWAVGAHRNDGGFDQTLTEHWDGTRWTIVPSVNESTGNNYLWNITCVAANDCWAVGSYDDASLGVSQTLIEHWDGAEWTIFPSPNANTQKNDLYAVTCIAANECWAVGSFDNGSDHPTLIEHWDGAVWSIVPSPNASQKSGLVGVTCVSASDCWAVGDDSVGSVLIEHWDGGSWSIVQSPITSNYAQLSDVKCLSSAQCWAVGNIASSQTLIEQWDGASWSIVSSPNAGTKYNGFSELTCTSAADCWAVGSFQNDTGGAGPLIEHWDGVSWTVDASPPKGSSNLAGVACSSGFQCWAVGQYIDDFAHQPFPVSQTFVEEFSLTVPPLTNVVSRLTHGSSQMFDVDLPLLGKRGVECRSGGANGNYSVVFSFVNDVTNCGSAGTVGGTVVAGPNSNQCTENLTGVTNAQYISVELDNVVDAQNNTGNVAVPMGVLIGDVNATGGVDGNDVSAVQGATRQTVNSMNFRYDVNASGNIDGNDVSITQGQTRTSLPNPP